MDRLNTEARSLLMGRIRSTDTQPELVVRRLLFSLGYRYRLHHRRLPGRPDIVFAGRRKAVFVHGCFWHAHRGCKRSFQPKNRAEYWRQKLDANRARDERNLAMLRSAGWDSFVVWECETARADLGQRLVAFLDPMTPPAVLNQCLTTSP